MSHPERKKTQLPPTVPIQTKTAPRQPKAVSIEAKTVSTQAKTVALQAKRSQYRPRQFLSSPKQYQYRPKSDKYFFCQEKSVKHFPLSWRFTAYAALLFVMPSTYLVVWCDQRRCSQPKLEKSNPEASALLRPWKSLWRKQNCLNLPNCGRGQ